MRPAVLFPLFAQVTGLKGVGDVAAKALQRLIAPVSPLKDTDEASYPTLRDLLFHLPSGLVDRRHICHIIEAPVGQVVTLQVTVQSHHAPPRGGRRPYRVIASDESGDVVLTFFNVKSDYLTKTLPEAQVRIISGLMERFDGMAQISHPDIITTPDKLADVATLEPQYPLTYAITQKQLRFFMQQALAKLPTLTEWHDAALLAQQGWPSFTHALRLQHQPQEVSDIALESPSRRRLAYDEIMASQLALAMVRSRAKAVPGVVCPVHSTLQQQLIATLPFVLTAGQHQVLDDIMADLSSGERMLRLLQGDVGSGKTVVALLAMMPMIEAGYQAALMVPTEILGRQHVQSIRKLIEPLGLRCELLSGKMTAKEREQVRGGLADGSIHIAVGTHALFQESVSFHKLGMVVIDEQHRFGVAQRLALSQKGEHPHILLMTATPIPRSLTMTAYGDMDASALTEKPANRLPIATRAVTLERVDEVVEGLRRAIASGSKIYWICPLVEEQDPTIAKEFEGDLAAAEERFRVFTQIFGERVGLAHGKMKSAERQAAMQGFAGDAYDILVATTVVEVGVDVPEATVIVIEHAERFGLAQLHQLRGRVGRGDKPSSCILLYHSRCSEVARKRLSIIRESNDGFYIAEEDLILRGAGDILGTRQSGLPDFRFINLALHRDLISTARDDVKLTLHRDASLQSERGQALRTLLYLFGYDESLRLLQAG